LKARLTEQARSVPAAVSKPRALHWIFDWAAGLAVAAAAILLMVSYQSNRELRNLTAALSNRVAELETRNAQQLALYATVTSPDVRVVNLAGQGASAGASGRIFWDEQARRWLFYVRHLDPAPADRTYQLWFVPTAGNPVSATIFNTQADGSAVMEIPVPPNIDTLKAAAVTTEPAGGLPQPSGAYALLGAVE
jgi:anti-sigma-K factor RskA